MRILVTGGAGFIGTALANRLVTEGHEVRVLDDLSAGDRTRLAPQVIFTRGDVNDMPRLWSVLQGIECVYHLAARVSVTESEKYARDYNTVNVGGTVSVMEAVRDVGVKRVILASSGAVYGEVMPGINHPDAPFALREDMPPNPRSPYAVSKLASEYYVKSIGALCSAETASIRLFNVYGPGQIIPASYPPVVPAFIRRAMRGESLVIYGSGEQTRDYVYIDDAVTGLVAALTAPGLNGLVVNIGSGRETSVNAVVTAISRLLGRDIAVIRGGTHSLGVSRMAADLTRAQQLLGYTPQIALEDGLRRTLAQITA